MWVGVTCWRNEFLALHVTRFLGYGGSTFFSWASSGVSIRSIIPFDIWEHSRNLDNTCLCRRGEPNKPERDLSLEHRVINTRRTRTNMRIWNSVRITYTNELITPSVTWPETTNIAKPELDITACASWFLHFLRVLKCRSCFITM